MALRNRPHFRENEQASFSPVHGLSPVTKEWIRQQEVYFKRPEEYRDSDRDHLYKLEPLRDQIDDDIEASNGEYTREQLETIKRELVSIYDHGSQYGIDFIQIAED